MQVGEIDFGSCCSCFFYDVLEGYCETWWDVAQEVVPEFADAVERGKFLEGCLSFVGVWHCVDFAWDESWGFATWVDDAEALFDAVVVAQSG